MLIITDMQLRVLLYLYVLVQLKLPTTVQDKLKLRHFLNSWRSSVDRLVGQANKRKHVISISLFRKLKASHEVWYFKWLLFIYRSLGVAS
jgi:hypothetical protein